MACVLLTRMLHGTTVSSQSRPSTPRLNGSADQRQHNLSSSKRTRSLARLKSVLFTKMKPEPPVSVVLSGVPTWLNPGRIEDRLRGISTLIRVRHRKYSYQTTEFDLILDFEPGTDAFASLQITTIEPCIIIDHVELQVSPLGENLRLKDVRIVSKLKALPNFSDAPGDQSHHYELKLNDLGAGQGECYVCRNELDGPFSTPCWTCRNPECYDCMRNHFKGALQDHERFPARCCGIAFHPDTAKGILLDHEHATYKARFEERLTKSPVYCPVPTCSAFIPPRLVQPLQGTVSDCHACQTSICMLCEKEAHIGQPCIQKNGDREKLDIVQKFGYKQCPKCGTGVGKMYGCSHVRCSCGAHWCWDCRRRIEICNASPCEEARGGTDDFYDSIVYDQESVIDSSSESDSRSVRTTYIVDNHENSVEEIQSRIDSSNVQAADSSRRVLEMSAALVMFHRRADTPIPNITADEETILNSMQTNVQDPEPNMAQQEHVVNESATPQTDTVTTTENTDLTIIADTSHPTPETMNLDDPGLQAWEATSFDFGSEPEDDDPLDVWGCIHLFEPATHNRIPRHWMTASIPDWWERDAGQREIECMVCWKAIKVAPKPSEIEKMEEGEVKRKTIKDWRFARRCIRCGIFVCRRCRNELVNTQME